MASKSNVYAGVAGYVGRADQKGTVGVFTRPAETGRWEHVLADHEAYTVNVHPTDPNVVFAGTADGVYRSTDRGKTFRRTNFPDKVQIWSFLVDANDRKLIYAGGSPISLYRSEDTGETWHKLPDPGMPDRAVMPFACRVMRLAQHPSHPGTIFAALEVNGVMRTTDGGESWSDCSSGLIELAQKPHLKSKIVSDTYNEGMLDGHAIAISPADPDKVIVAVRMGLFETADGGKTWQDMELGRFSPTTYGRDIKVSPEKRCTPHSASPPPARTARCIAAPTTARRGNVSTRCRCTAPSCRSRCTTPTPIRSLSVPATTARFTAPRMVVRRGIRCRCRPT